MTHFGVICPTSSGHLNPMTTLGYELQQRGHRVTVIGLPDAEAAARAAGLGFRAIAAAQFPPGASAQFMAELGELSGLAAFRYTVALFQRFTTILLDEASAPIEQVGIEALLVDQASLGGTTVAQRLKLPYISLACALLMTPDPQVPPFNTPWPYVPGRWGRWRNQVGYQLLGTALRPITQAVNADRQRWHLPPLRHLYAADSPLLQISQQPASFEFPRSSLPACLHFTGPWGNPASRAPAPFPWERLTGQPLIYASLGTLQNRLLDTFRTIAAACAELDAQLVIALGGGSAPESLANLPGSPLVVGFAPQLDLLRRATLTITHAGMNTTLESLAQGVPLVAIPITNDQPAVAARIAWSGVGEVVPSARLTVDRLRRAIGRVLAEPSYRHQAQRQRSAIQQAGGVQTAADLVERAIATGQPVLAMRS